MTDFQITLRYQTLTKQRLTIFCLIWAGLGFLLAKALVLATAALSGWLVSVLAIIFGIMYCLVPVILCIDQLSGNKIYVDKRGLVFSPWIVGLGSKLIHEWSDLKVAQVYWQGADIYGPQDCLELKFRSGGSANLKLSKIGKTDLEQLLLAIEVWARDCIKPIELITFQEQLQNENKGLGRLSYTQLWEEELSRRFQATTFVPLEPGKVINGKYTVMRRIAFGGFSAIHLAKRNDGTLVVLKEVVTVGTQPDSQKKAKEIFAREVQVLSKLDHPGIAKILDSFTENDRNYMVIEYVPGHNLRQLVANSGSPSEQTIIRWATQMASILEHLSTHEPPVVHRDFTPDNLVLRDDGHIVLIDFGAANEYVGTATGTLVGKQCYMAPEQVRGKALPASDIYSMGCTIFFLLTGEDPEAITQSDPRTVKKEISKPLADLVSEMTNLDFAKRPSAIELVSRLTNLLPTKVLS